ncbi:MAG: hypothetical protein ACKVWR_01745 [Acidimicrobiales bacterium]
MKLERLAIEAEDRTVVAWDLHPKLTVVTGLARPARQSVASWFIESLRTSLCGVHLELQLDTGEHLAAFRPYGGGQVVVDVDHGADVSAAFRTPSGAVDLLRRPELSPERLAQAMWVEARALAVTVPTDHWIVGLASRSGDELFRAAEAAAAAEDELDAAAQDPDLPRDAQRYAAVGVDLERAQRNHDRVRVATLVAGVTLPIGAVVGLSTIGTAGALGLIGGSLALATGCLAYERKLARLVAGAAASGGGDPASAQARLVAAAEASRATHEQWTLLAGPEIPPRWALDHRDQIAAAAAVLGATLRIETLGARPEDGAQSGASPATARMAAALVSRLAAARANAGGGETLPLFIDDPLGELEPTAKASVLELLGRLAAHQQIVLLTADEDIASWARIEALTGELALLECGPSAEPGVDAAPYSEPAR